jgi:hypothetical protein
MSLRDVIESPPPPPSLPPISTAVHAEQSIIVHRHSHTDCRSHLAPELHLFHPHIDAWRRHIPPPVLRARLKSKERLQLTLPREGFEASIGDS